MCICQVHDYHIYFLVCVSSVRGKKTDYEKKREGPRSKVYTCVCVCVCVSKGRQDVSFGGGAELPKCLATVARAINFCASPEKVAQCVCVCVWRGRGGGGGGLRHTHTHTRGVRASVRKGLKKSKII